MTTKTTAANYCTALIETLRYSANFAKATNSFEHHQQILELVCDELDKTLEVIVEG